MNTMDQTDRTFMKMHGLGNDFVVLDGRARKLAMTPALATALADRHRGVGFDQLAVIVPGAEVDAELIFYNADGSISAACGNATRCIARHLMDETGKTRLRLKAGARVLEARDAGQGLTSVNMGPPETHWQGVPLARAMETLELPIEGGPTATGMGNPHCTFFVADAEAVDLESRGPEIENHPLFPERTNVQFVSVTGENILRMRVWERGAGLTQACGTGACATAVHAMRRGLVEREVTVTLPGGDLTIAWGEDNRIRMTGPATEAYRGNFEWDDFA